MLILNRKLAVSSTKAFIAAIAVQLFVIVVDTVNYWADENKLFPDERSSQYKLLVVTSMLSYMLRPVTIMVVSFIVIPDTKYRLPCSVPAIANAVIYALNGASGNYIYITGRQHRWNESIAGFSILYTEIFYLFLLAFFSIIYFKWDDLKRAAIVLLICIQSILTVILEETGMLADCYDTVASASLLEYYFYLSLIYQNEIQNEIVRKESMLAQQKTTLLRTQIHPHFILNSLSIIRSLAKRDSKKAVECIDSFADYLSVHIRAINSDTVISFSEELRHVEAYLSLVQADTARRIDIRYDLKAVDFMLPPLTLEPLIENSVKYGTGSDNSYIRISTEENAEGEIVICVEDSGSDTPPETQDNKSTGVGIDNTRLRLSLKCIGELELKKKPGGGMAAVIRLLKIQEVRV